jgi:toxin ParE1/3/4
MKASLSPRAIRVLLEATEAIAGNSRRVAREFRASVDDALTMIGRHPEIGAERRELADPPVRFWTLTRHNYLMVYNSSRDPPRILQLVHGARDLPALLSGLRSD